MNFSRCHFVSLILSSATFLLLHSVSANLGFSASENDITIHEANGYKVYFINTHIGNSLALYYAVRVGSAHDEPVRGAGAAHFLEHWVHQSTNELPERGQLFKMLRELPGSYNASTGSDMTKYHWSGHGSNFEKAARLVGSVVSSPQLDDEFGRREMQVVKNEALEYQGRDNQIFHALHSIELLPNLHPFKKFAVGLQHQLENMDLDYVRSIFYTNYNPNHAAILVAGNFDQKTKLKEKVPTVDHLLSTIRAHFHPPIVPEKFLTSNQLVPGSQMVFPDIDIDSSGIRTLKLYRENTYSMRYSFQIPSALDNPDELSVFDAYLSSKLDGSLKSQLIKSELVNNFYTHYTCINSLSVFDFYFDLPDGSDPQKINQILARTIAALAEIRDRGIPLPILDQIKSLRMTTLKDYIRNPDSVADFVSGSLDLTEQRLLNLTNAEARFGQITSENIQKMVSEFNPTRGRLSLTGPLDTAQMAKHSAFNRFYNVDHDQTLRDVLVKSWNNPDHTSKVYDQIHLPSLPFALLPRDKKRLTKTVSITSAEKPQLLENNWSSFKGAIQKEPSANSRALAAFIDLGPLTMDEVRALDIFLHSYHLRFKSILEYLGSVGEKISFSRSGSSLSLSISGEPSNVHELLKWFLTEIKLFKPDPLEVDQAISSLVRNAKRELQGFSAIRAFSAGSVLSRGKHHYQNGELYLSWPQRSVNAELIQQTVQKTLESGYIFAVDYGLTSPHLAKKTFTLLRESFASRPRTVHLPVDISAFDKQFLWLEADDSKKDDQLGVSRFYSTRFHRYSSEEYALEAIIEMASSEIFKENREIRDLGYVQGANPIYSTRYIQFGLVGQVNRQPRDHDRSDIELLNFIWSGWEKVIEKFKTGQIPLSEFSNALLKLKDSYLIETFEEDDKASEILYGLISSNDPTAHDQQLEKINKLSPERLRDLGSKIFGGEIFSVVSSRKYVSDLPCEGVFGSLKEFRKHL